MEELPILGTYPEFEDVPEDRFVSGHSSKVPSPPKRSFLFADRVKRVPNQIGSDDGKIAHRQLFRGPQYDLFDARLYSRREPTIFSSESRCHSDQVF